MNKSTCPGERLGARYGRTLKHAGRERSSKNGSGKRLRTDRGLVVARKISVQLVTCKVRGRATNIESVEGGRAMQKWNYDGASPCSNHDSAKDDEASRLVVDRASQRTHQFKEFDLPVSNYITDVDQRRLDKGDLNRDNNDVTYSGKSAV